MSWWILLLIVLGGLGGGVGWWWSQKTRGEFTGANALEEATRQARQNPTQTQDPEKLERAREFARYLRNIWEAVQKGAQQQQEALEAIGVSRLQEDEKTMELFFLDQAQNQRARIEFTTLWIGLEQPEDRVPYVLFWDDIESTYSPEEVADELLTVFLEEN